MNKVVLVGRLTKDVDLRQSGNSAVAKFTIAVDRKFKNNEGKYEADFINAVAFGKTAEFISKYFSKGMKIGIVGRIQTGSYTNKDGVKIHTCDICIEDVEFVESKNTNVNAQPNNQSVMNELNGTDGFVNIDDSLDELPFA